MDCRYLDDLYELYLLGALAPEESAAIREHIERQCPYCSEHIGEAVLTVYFLSLPAQKARVPAKVKSGLMRRLRKKK
jgi:hypothetical protein